MDSRELPNVTAAIEHNKKKITIIGTHPFPPFGKRNSLLRDEHIAALGKYIAEKDSPTLLVGDLNASPFSDPYRKLLSAASLSNCANGFGYTPTWQFGPLTPPLGIKIDHCLVTPGIIVTESKVGASIGSDHRPIINRILLP